MALEIGLAGAGDDFDQELEVAGDGARGALLFGEVASQRCAAVMELPASMHKRADFTRGVDGRAEGEGGGAVERFAERGSHWTSSQPVAAQQFELVLGF